MVLYQCSKRGPYQLKSPPRAGTRDRSSSRNWLELGVSGRESETGRKGEQRCRGHSIRSGESASTAAGRTSYGPTTHPSRAGRRTLSGRSTTPVLREPSQRPRPAEWSGQGHKNGLGSAVNTPSPKHSEGVSTVRTHSTTQPQRPTRLTRIQRADALCKYAIAVVLWEVA